MQRFELSDELWMRLEPLLPNVRKRAREHELKLRGYQVERQLELPVIYKGVRLDCGFRVDLMVVDQVVVEIKAAKEHHPRHEAQTLTYLRLSDKRVGLLLNFGVDTLKGRDQALGQSIPRESLLSSASSAPLR